MQERVFKKVLLNNYRTPTVGIAKRKIANLLFVKF